MSVVRSHLKLVIFVISMIVFFIPASLAILATWATGGTDPRQYVPPVLLRDRDSRATEPQAS